MAFRKHLLKRFKGAFLLLGGASLFIVGAWLGAGNFAFLKKSERTTGEIAKVIEEAGVKGVKLYYPLVRFRLPEGRTRIMFKARPGLIWTSPFAAGDEVEVAYDPKRSENAKIVSFWMLWFLPIVATVFGLACLLAGGSTLRKAA